MASERNSLLLHFHSQEPSLKGVTVTVRHEMYDGVPVLSKNITISNNSDHAITVDSFKAEILAAVEGESAVDSREPGQWRRPPIDVLSDYMFHGMDIDTANRVATWEPDPDYSTQVSYNLQTPCLFVCKPPMGPGIILPPGDSLSYLRVFLVVQDQQNELGKAWPCGVFATWLLPGPPRIL